MKRIETSDNLFSDGDPQNNIKGTRVTAGWLNMIQEEIANLIEGFGIVLDPDKDDQMFSTIESILHRKNKIINGCFRVNQRAVGGTVVLAAGEYGHDRFKAGTSGCSYTFATTNNITTITIASGSLKQIVEGCNIQTGKHTLSWLGTAQGRINSGSYGDSGQVKSTLTGGTNTTVEFGLGTLALVQLEHGLVATEFEDRIYTDESSFCKRYYRSNYPPGVSAGGITGHETMMICTSGIGTLPHRFFIFGSHFDVAMRCTPTVSIFSASGVSGQICQYNNTPVSRTVSVVDASILNLGTFIETTVGDTAEPYAFNYVADAEL